MKEGNESSAFSLYCSIDLCDNASACTCMKAIQIMHSGAGFFPHKDVL